MKVQLQVSANQLMSHASSNCRHANQTIERFLAPKNFGQDRVALRAVAVGQILKRKNLTVYDRKLDNQKQ